MHVKCKNVNFIYSAYALSYKSTKLSQFIGMSLKQRKQILQKNVTYTMQLEIPTGRTCRPVGYLRGLRLLPRTNPASGRVEALSPGPLDYNTSTLNHSATLSEFRFFKLSYTFRQLHAGLKKCYQKVKLDYLQ